MGLILDILMTLLTGGLWLFVIFSRGSRGSKKVTKELRKINKKL